MSSFLLRVFNQRLFSGEIDMSTVWNNLATPYLILSLFFRVMLDELLEYAYFLWSFFSPPSHSFPQNALAENILYRNNKVDQFQKIVIFRGKSIGIVEMCYGSENKGGHTCHKSMSIENWNIERTNPFPISSTTFVALYSISAGADIRTVHGQLY